MFTVGLTQASPSGISKGTYHLFIGNLVSTIVLAIVSIVVGRLLGPSGFGLYTIALIVPNYIYLVLRLGATTTISRYAAKYLSEGNEKKAVSFSYTISILHLALGLLVTALLIPFTGTISADLLHRPELSSGLIVPIALLSVVGQILFYNGIAAFVGLHSFDKAAVFQIAMSVAKLVISVFFLLIGYSVLGAVIGYSFGFIAAGFIALSLLIFLNKSAIPRNLRQDVTMSADYAWPIFLSILLQGVVVPLQNTILAYTVSNTEIGWYSAAVNIAALIALFTYPVSTILLPLFSRSVPEGSQQLIQSYRTTLKYTAIFVTPATMLVITLSTPLATAIYGHAYAASGHYLIGVAAVYLLSGFGYISWSPLLYGVGETRRGLIATAFGAAITIFVSVILAMYVGVYGVIIGAILGNIASVYIGSRFVSTVLGGKIGVLSLWKIYVSSAVCALIVYPIAVIRLNPFLAVAIGGLAFLLILIPAMALSKSVTRDEMSTLQLQFKDVKLVSFILNLIGKYHSLFAKQ